MSVHAEPEISSELAFYGHTSDTAPAFLRKTLGFKHPAFRRCRERQDALDEFFILPLQVKEGAQQCRFCGSNQTYCIERQTRSCDEGTTIIVHCSACRRRFRES